jgi:hypothetical protein
VIELDEVTEPSFKAHSKETNTVTLSQHFEYELVCTIKADLIKSDSALVVLTDRTPFRLD